jgi:geranylgeranyl diphosphate synthase type I
MDFKNYLSKTHQQIEKQIKHFLDQKLEEAKKAGSPAEAMIKKIHQLSLRGKMVRGMLVKLSYQACGGRDIKKAVKLSAGIEILETSFLILDDVMDQDETRRGIPTIHKQFAKQKDNWYGVSMAINSGVLALTLAYELIENEQVLAEIFKYSEQTAFGQALDITLKPLDKLERQDIDKIHYYKTVCYTTLLPVTAGAVLAGEKNKAKLKALKNYALYLGQAFQIQDDILGVFGDSKTTGKPAGNDLREGKRTYLIVDTIKKLRRNHLRGGVAPAAHLGGEEMEQFKKKFKNKDIDWLRNQIKKSGALNKSVKMAQGLAEKAKNQVDKITQDKKLGKIFIDLAEFVVKRRK